MYAGDKGPLRPQRADTVNGLAPSTADPITDEYKFLTPLDPTKLAPMAKAFLEAAGVHKVSTLPANAPMILIGEPRVVERNGIRKVVWKILNKDVPGWKRIPPGVADDTGVFSDIAIGDGLYCGGANGDQVFLQSESDGQAQLDLITAQVGNNYILFCTHSPGWSGSVYHEILHTFEGKELVNSFFLKEGIVEFCSLKFALDKFNVKLEPYGPYKLAADNAAKLVDFTSFSTVCKAYFADDKDAIKQLIPLFYEKIYQTLGADKRIESSCLADVKGKWGELNRLLLVSPFKLKSKSPDSEWYVDWVGKNGVPKGGPQLPE